MKRCRKFLTGLFLIVLGCALFFVYRLPEFESWNLPRLSDFDELPYQDYLPVVEKLISDGKYETALAMILYVRGHHLPNRLRILDLKFDLEKKIEARRGIVKNAVSGFVKGKGEGVAAESAAVAADILVVGDFRDLVVELSKYFQDEDADEFMIALSAVGLLSSAATLFPEPATTAAGVPVEVGIASLKGLRRVGALSDDFADSLMILFKEARKTKKLGSLTGIFGSIGDIRKHCPRDAFARIMKQVRSVDDMKRVAIAMENYPNETVVLFEVAGADGMKELRSLDEGFRPVDWGKILTKGKRGLKYAGNAAGEMKLALEAIERLEDTGSASERTDGGGMDIPSVKADPLNQVRNWLARRIRLRRYVFSIAVLSIAVGAWGAKNAILGKSRPKIETGRGANVVGA